MLVFFDYILIYNCSIESRVEHLKLIMETLRNNQLFAKLSKCTHSVKKVEYFDQIVSVKGVETDFEKTESFPWIDKLL